MTTDTNHPGDYRLTLSIPLSISTGDGSATKPVEPVEAPPHALRRRIEHALAEWSDGRYSWDVEALDRALCEIVEGALGSGYFGTALAQSSRVCVYGGAEAIGVHVAKTNHVTPTTIAVQTEIAHDRISSLLCSAFEGGMSRHWCRIHSLREPAYVPEHLRSGTTPSECHYTDLPLCEGGAVLCYDAAALAEQLDAIEAPSDADPDDVVEEKDLLVLDRDAVTRGLALMATVAPHHYGDFISNRSDAITGDVFLQLCLLGEVRYG